MDGNTDKETLRAYVKLKNGLEKKSKYIKYPKTW